MYPGYPLWNSTSKSKWTAQGIYINENINIEQFQNNDENDEETYQDYMYSIAVYFYKKNAENKLEFKNVKTVQLKKPKTDKIPELDYSNTTSDDIKSEFNITVVDLTSYLPKQPMLNIKYIVNNGEIINKISFAYPNPTDPKMREYSFDVRPFKTMSFIFDLEVMNPNKSF